MKRSDAFKAAAKQANDEHDFCAVELKTDIGLLEEQANKALKSAASAIRTGAEYSAETEQALRGVAAAGIATLRDFDIIEGKSWNGDDSPIEKVLAQEAQKQDEFSAKIGLQPTPSILLGQVSLGFAFGVAENFKKGDEKAALESVRKVTAAALRGLEKF